MSFANKTYDWSNLSVLYRNRLPTRAHFYPFQSREDALSLDRIRANFQSLNGTWKFHHAESPLKAPEWDVAEPHKWHDIVVPGMWQLQSHGRSLYSNVNYPFPVDPPNVPLLNETGSYWREFTTSCEWAVKHRQTRLRFEGVDSAFHVWVNGVEVSYSQGSRNPAEFDICPLLKEPGESNTIAVRVYELCDGSYIERQDQWSISGIFRDVYLVAFDDVSIVDIEALPDVELDRKSAQLNVRLAVEGAGDGQSGRAELLSPSGDVLRQEEKRASTEITFQLSVSGNDLHL